ncbi:hypothetical protein KKF34_15290 [Myxococcota bacterium]|nr:hypothetical protein [Myxococcota bacterium]MBU1383068.1 hypothetical protein [Myxococcota bacterium]MBU1498241.1 hypothetical protein [Myxococcota bacterium]
MKLFLSFLFLLSACTSYKTNSRNFKIKTLTKTAYDQNSKNRDSAVKELCALPHPQLTSTIFTLANDADKSVSKAAISCIFSNKSFWIAHIGAFLSKTIPEKRIKYFNNLFSLNWSIDEKELIIKDALKRNFFDNNYAELFAVTKKWTIEEHATLLRILTHHWNNQPHSNKIFSNGKYTGDFGVLVSQYIKFLDSFHGTLLLEKYLISFKNLPVLYQILPEKLLIKINADKKFSTKWFKDFNFADSEMHALEKHMFIFKFSPSMCKAIARNKSVLSHLLKTALKTNSVIHFNNIMMLTSASGSCTKPFFKNIVEFALKMGKSILYETPDFIAKMESPENITVLKQIADNLNISESFFFLRLLDYMKNQAPVLSVLLKKNDEKLHFEILSKYRPSYEEAVPVLKHFIASKNRNYKAFAYLAIFHLFYPVDSKLSNELTHIKNNYNFSDYYNTNHYRSKNLFLNSVLYVPNLLPFETLSNPVDTAFIEYFRKGLGDSEPLIRSIFATVLSKGTIHYPQIRADITTRLRSETDYSILSQYVKISEFYGVNADILTSKAYVLFKKTGELNEDMLLSGGIKPAFLIDVLLKKPDIYMSTYQDYFNNQKNLPDHLQEKLIKLCYRDKAAPNTCLLEAINYRVIKGKKAISILEKILMGTNSYTSFSYIYNLWVRLSINDKTIGQSKAFGDKFFQLWAKHYRMCSFKSDDKLSKNTVKSLISQYNSTKTSLQFFTASLLPMVKEPERSELIRTILNGKDKQVAENLISGLLKRGINEPEAVKILRERNINSKPDLLELAYLLKFGNPNDFDQIFSNLKKYILFNRYRIRFFVKFVSTNKNLHKYSDSILHLISVDPGNYCNYIRKFPKSPKTLEFQKKHCPIKGPCHMEDRHCFDYLLTTADTSTVYISLTNYLAWKIKKVHASNIKIDERLVLKALKQGNNNGSLLNYLTHFKFKNPTIQHEVRKFLSIKNIESIYFYKNMTTKNTSILLKSLAGNFDNVYIGSIFRIWFYLTSRVSNPGKRAIEMSLYYLKSHLNQDSSRIISSGLNQKHFKDFFLRHLNSSSITGTKSIILMSFLLNSIAEKNRHHQAEPFKLEDDLLKSVKKLSGNSDVPGAIACAFLIRSSGDLSCSKSITDLITSQDVSRHALGIQLLTLLKPQHAKIFTKSVNDAARKISGLPSLFSLLVVYSIEKSEASKNTLVKAIKKWQKNYGHRLPLSTTLYSFIKIIGMDNYRELLNAVENPIITPMDR